MENQATYPWTIRGARLTDLDAIVEANIRLADESESKTLDPAVLRAGVKAGLADPDHKGPYFVAEENGVILGLMQITFEWSDWRNGWAWWIQGVYVRPEARRRGVFRSLYQHVHRLARENKEVVALRLYVERDNVKAQQTYLDLGMEWLSYGMMQRYPL